MLARCTEPTAERGKFGRPEILFAEHKHRMFGESAPDPGEGRLIEWRCEIDAQRLGADRLAQGAKLGRIGHGRSSDVVAKQPRPATAEILLSRSARQHISPSR